MDITYEKDLPSDLGHKMKGGQWLNWIHPSHGPFPDLLGELRATTEDRASGAFIGAAWLTEQAILTAVEALELNGDGDVWLGSRILRTYRWKPDEQGMVCGSRKVRVIGRPDEVGEEDVEEEWAWKRGVMIGVLMESVWLNVNTKVGEIMRGTELQGRGRRALPKARKVY